MNKLIKIALIGALLITCFCGCGHSDDFRAFDKEESLLIEGGVISENTGFRLEWDGEKSRILLYDKIRGQYWSNIPKESLEPQIDEYGIEKNVHPQMESPILVEYIEPGVAEVKTIISYNASIRNGRIRAEKVNAGLRVTYFFDEYEISVPVEYTLREEGFSAAIDADNICENKNKVYRISMLPFFCAVKNTAQNAYLFVPSGAGALIEPREIKNGLPLKYSEEVFGQDPQRYPKNETKATVTESVRLPVFGFWNGETGAAAIIEDGAESASVEATIGSVSIGYSAAYATFSLRGFQIMQSVIGSQKKETVQYSENRRGGRFSVLFQPLKADESGYSGIAGAYSDYLEKYTGLSESTTEHLYNLQLLGGAKITKSLFGVPYKQLKALTTVEQAGKIIDELAGETGVNPAVNLSGFGESGLDKGKIAGGYTLSKTLGSKKDLQKLFSKAKSAEIPLFMEFDSLSFSKSGGGVSMFTDKAAGANLKAVYNYEYNIWSRTRISGSAKSVLIKRGMVKEVADKLLGNLKGLGVSGVNLSALSSTAYSDFSDVKYIAKGRAPEDTDEIFASYKNAGISVASASANAYAAVLSDHIFDAPSQSSAFDCFDEEVPFYQMVFKGRVSLSPASINLASNAQSAFLRCVEAGTGLAFTLGGEYDTALIRSSHPGLYGVLYDDVKNDILSYISRYSEFFNAVSGSRIREHQILENKLRKTVFDNGIIVLVNYSNEDISTEYGTVTGMNYLYTREGG